MKKILVATVVMILLSLTYGVAYAGDLAVIVNKENVTDGVSYKDLVKIFKQEKKYWEDGQKIYLVMHETGSSEKRIALKKIYKMGDEELKKFWLAKMFRGEIPSFPKTLGSSEAIKRLVGQVPNSIGLIDAALVDGSVKVLRIEGRLPGEKGYVLGESDS